jgi:hypothetical protein
MTKDTLLATEGRRQGFRSRRASSVSTASRMNSARLPAGTSASMRASVSSGKRTAVNFPIGGRPIRAGLSDNFFCANPLIFPLSPIDYSRYRFQIGVIGYGGK